MSRIELHLLGEELVARAPAERMADEVYRTIPALDDLAQAATRVASKLSHEARDGLFFGAGKLPPDLRVLSVEHSLTQIAARESIQPDLEYFKGAERVQKADFAKEQVNNDPWLSPSNS